MRSSVISSSSSSGLLCFTPCGPPLLLLLLLLLLLIRFLRLEGNHLCLSIYLIKLYLSGVDSIKCYGPFPPG